MAGNTTKLNLLNAAPRLGALLVAAPLLFPGGVLWGAELDPAKLPPPANATPDFELQVKPILERSCLRCHGPERPKSHFRLDNRESALKGGDNGIDIVPGDSKKSPLIYYVARVVEEMEMPPPGKGDPLTPDEVGVLRAWIDQGAAWGATNPPLQFSVSIEPALRWIGVHGDTGKFREIEGVQEGFGRGVENFSMFQQITPDTTVSVEGRALSPDKDLLLSLAVVKTDVGFVRGGVDEWRRYYDDTGGYYRPFAVPAFSLDRDLHLDIGKAWVDFGLTLPRLPQIVLDYEYQFNEGDINTLEWGEVNGKNIYPGTERIHEHTQILKFDLTYDFYEWRLEDSARVEFYNDKTGQDAVGSFTLGPAPDSIVNTAQELTHVQGMNTLHLERQVKDWWLVSGGYYFSKFDGTASLNQTTVNSLGVPTAGSFWSSDDIVLKRDSQIVSFANLFQPLEWLSASAAIQSEWTHQEGAGDVSLDSGDPNLPDSFILYPTTIQSDLDKQKLSENASLRFTKIPWTVLFAETRLDQERISQAQSDMATLGTEPDPNVQFARDADFKNYRYEYRAGFDTSPWHWVALSAHVKRTTSDSDYNNMVDSSTAYPGFIRARSIDTDEAQTKLILHPASWLKTTLTYQVTDTDYNTTTGPVPGGTIPEGLLAGKYDAHTYGLNLTLTPFQRLYFSGTLTYTQSRTRTASHQNPSIVPYKGDGYGIIVGANYTLNQLTELHAAYVFSSADYGQNNVADGLPLGLNYTHHALIVGVSRRLATNLTTSLRYGFYQYSDSSTGGINNYTANGIFATLTMKWP